MPSALTYNVRQLEDALDVLLFDRRSRQATLTAAGQELLDEGRRLLEQMRRRRQPRQARRHRLGDAAQRSPSTTSISRSTLLELCERVLRAATPALRAATRAARRADATRRDAPTRLRLRTEVLAGTWEALVTGQADLAIGVGVDRELPSGVAIKELGDAARSSSRSRRTIRWPRRPSRSTDGELVRHRAVAVADSAQRLRRSPSTCCRARTC